ncbi:MAG: sigma-70 family RNA polymerase sigma factor [Clostridia bacterium]|nr:sigma-70 family RNA polymerase sigma factor [Clostridia bacterium]
MQRAPVEEESAEERLTALVEAHQETLLKICYVYLRDREAARDAVQETFLKAYRAMHGFRGACSEKTWLIRIAVNECRSMRRSAWHRRVDRRVTPEELPVAADARDEAAADVMAAVLSLPRRYREAVTLYYWQDMTVQEIAGVLGVAQSTVSVRLRQARERLRHVLEGREDE